jgi:hypothetical protein
MDPATLSNPNKIPNYTEVVTWAYQVAYAYDSRVAGNRHATRAGAITAVTLAGVMAGLATYGAGTVLLPGLALSGGFVGGLGAVYQNDAKADLYSRAAGKIVAILDASALRVAQHGPTALEAACLKLTVSAVQRTVALHVTALTPADVARVLTSVSGETKIAEAFGVRPGDFRDLDVVIGAELTCPTEAVTPLPALAPPKPKPPAIKRSGTPNGGADAFADL